MRQLIVMELRAVDAAVWEAAYREHATHLTRLATMLVGPHDAHDLVADTVMRCVSTRQWPAVENQGGYLTRALVRSAHTRVRSDRSRRRRERMVGTWRPTQDGSDAAGDTQALQALSPSQAAVVYLLYWEDMTIADVAARLDVSQGTVRKQLDRAKRRLRKVMSDDDDR